MIYLASNSSFGSVKHYYFDNNDILVVELVDYMDYNVELDEFINTTMTIYYRDSTSVEEFVYKLPKKLRYIKDVNQIKNILEEKIFNKL